MSASITENVSVSSSLSGARIREYYEREPGWSVVDRTAWAGSVAAALLGPAAPLVSLPLKTLSRWAGKKAVTKVREIEHF